VGLDSAKLEAAAEANRNIGTPFCLAVVKDGQLVIDSNYGFGQGERKIESMSSGKTISAAMVGVAIQQGLFDLNTPLAQYGVVPHANWSLTGVDWWPNVTARHLITQTTGRGSVEPGSALTYDSDAYIQHLSFLLNTTAPGNQTAREWATRNFATPLGIPQLYAFEDADPAKIGDTPILGKTQISAGGDQPIACSDIARVGQLLVNKGLWNSGDGTPVRMLSEEYVKGFSTPQNPLFPYDKCGGHMCQQYSYLTYLTTTNDTGIPRNTSCALNNTGLAQVRGLPMGSLLAMGALGKYMMVMPEDKLVVVAFGSNLAHLECPNGSKGTFSTDEGLVMSQIWANLQAAVLPSQTLPKSSTRDQKLATKQPPPGPHSPFGPGPRPPPGPNPRRPHHPHFLQKPSVGACYCYCPHDQAIGRCMSGIASEDACTALADASHNGVQDFCPRVSMFYDCHDPRVDCSAKIFRTMTLQSNKSCTGPPNASLPLEKVQECSYVPEAFSKCYFLGNATCQHNPFFPLPQHQPRASVTPQEFFTI